MKKLLLLVSFLILTFTLPTCEEEEKPCTRIGAVCNDGTQTTATGQGACSHHDGVDYWICKEDQ